MRLPGKMLCEIAGRPLILRTLEQVRKARTVDRVIVATDDERIFTAVRESGSEVLMTSELHQSGSDRIAEVAESLPDASIIINVQGDEPMISPDTIDLAVTDFLKSNAGSSGYASADIVTVSEPIFDLADLRDPNVVKVVTDFRGYALYFSRAPIPYPRDSAAMSGNVDDVFQNAVATKLFRKHAGLYVYSREFLLGFTQQQQTGLEKLERLEQLRALENGARIRVVEAAGRSVGVDTAEDLQRVRRMIENNG